MSSIYSKICINCKEEKEIADFKQIGDGIFHRTNVCERCERDKYLEDLKKRPYNDSRQAHLIRNYCIDTEEYNKLFELQDGCCAICKIHQRELKRALAVDHCHKTKKVRGLLCSPCNTGLGFAKDNIEILKNMIVYLKESKKD